jgi:hypothetical protein
MNRLRTTKSNSPSPAATVAVRNDRVADVVADVGANPEIAARTVAVASNSMASTP